MNAGDEMRRQACVKLRCQTLTLKHSYSYTCTVSEGDTCKGAAPRRPGHEQREMRRRDLNQEIQVGANF